jgi:hypothetical protein
MVGSLALAATVKSRFPNQLPCVQPGNCCSGSSMKNK